MWRQTWIKIIITKNEAAWKYSHVCTWKYSKRNKIKVEYSMLVMNYVMYFRVSSLGITIMASISTASLPNLIHMLYQMGFWKRTYLFIQHGCLLSNAKLYIMSLAQIICCFIRGNGALRRATSDCVTSLPVFQLVWLMLNCLQVENKWFSLNFFNIKHFIT